MTRLALALPLLLAPLPAAAGGLPDGSYTCAFYYPSIMIVGDMRIEGDLYWGPALDGTYTDGPWSYRVKDDKVAWEGPLGGLSDAGIVKPGRISLDGQGREVDGYDLVIEVEGDDQTVFCSRQQG